MSEKPLVRYDGTVDANIPATQEWIDAVQRRLGEMARQRSELRRIINQPFVDEDNVVRANGS